MNLHPASRRPLIKRRRRAWLQDPALTSSPHAQFATRAARARRGFCQTPAQTTQAIADRTRRSKFGRTKASVHRCWHAGRLDDFPHSRGDVPRGDAEGVDQFLGLAGMRHAVDREQPRFRRRHARSRERGQNRFADAALGPVVFHGDQSSAGRAAPARPAPCRRSASRSRDRSRGSRFPALSTHRRLSAPRAA